MRVELVYTPGCTSYQKALSVLQTVIAEERLPLPVELTESTGNQAPRINIDGETLADSAHSCIEELRNQISAKWQDMTSKMLGHLT